MASSKLRDSALKSPKQLYKFLLRECERLPKNAQLFYKHSVKQSFKQHLIEPDKNRVQQIMEKAVQDAEWLLKKYSKAEGTKVQTK
ncbi:PREDICTED: LYR motif-containing protein 9-like [Habropoda laboriosa]|uniref:LYR motif-containing protein 9-like n=1 Tax=Habropoda laboriosa TaxID=597456 RepID=UPI00083D0FFB|nr:PREDICTED: LYR motif-containing protein 9-like [Habropoda laboriosa]